TDGVVAAGTGERLASGCEGKRANTLFMARAGSEQPAGGCFPYANRVIDFVGGRREQTAVIRKNRAPEAREGVDGEVGLHRHGLCVPDFNLILPTKDG